MDWNRTVLIGSQIVVFLGLLAAVLCGHNSVILDGLMAVSGSIVGAAMYTAVRKN